MSGAAFTPSDLFNCCTNAAAPDWSQFDALEIGGSCIDHEEPGGVNLHVHGGFTRDEAEFFTVYGHYKPGHGQGVDAITDCDTLERAEAVAAELARLSGLPVNVHC